MSRWIQSPLIWRNTVKMKGIGPICTRSAVSWKRWSSGEDRSTETDRRVEGDLWVNERCFFAVLPRSTPTIAHMQTPRRSRTLGPARQSRPPARRLLPRSLDRSLVSLNITAPRTYLIPGTALHGIALHLHSGSLSLFVQSHSPPPLRCPALFCLSVNVSGNVGLGCGAISFHFQ
jgi:hypothetical protein